MASNALEAKVIATNRANKRANELYGELAPIFEPLVGCKILKADGTLLASVAKLVPNYRYGDEPSVFRHTSNYSLAWTVKACETYPNQRGDCDIAHYYETVVYVGDLKGQVLEKITPPMVRREDYDAEEIRAARVAYQLARKTADNLFSHLHPFGEYDV